jgi:hypothetical protein
LKIYRGSPAAARAYVEADRARVDDYYLAEGNGLASRLVATPASVLELAPMDGPAYERWVAGRTVETDQPKGRLRSDDQAVRFVEVTVNGPKTWSLAAALDPAVAAAYDAAQNRAAHQIVGWLAAHATTPGGSAWPAGAGAGGADRGSGGAALHLPGPGTRTGICTCRSTPGSGPKGGGGVCTRSGSGTAWRRSTGSGTRR